MTIVNVLLPDRDKSKGEVDENAPWTQIKDDIIDAFLPGESKDDYDLLLLPSDPKAVLLDYTLADNDTLILLSTKQSSGRAFTPLNKS